LLNHSVALKGGLNRTGALNQASLAPKVQRLQGERYLPRKARQALSSQEYAATSAKKRRDTAAGKQFSSQPEKIRKKTRRKSLLA